MRPFLLLCALTMAVTCSAAAPKSLAEAWQYVAKPKQSARWVVVSSNVNDGFFQCENVDEVVRGVIPLWGKVKPGVSRTSFGNGSETPHPDVAGSELIERMSSEKARKAQAVLKRFGIDARPIYSQVVDAKGELVGTQCDLCFVLEFSFKNFSELVQQYMLEVHGVRKDAGYRFETDSS